MIKNPIGVSLVAGLGLYLIFRGTKEVMTDDEEQIEYIARTAWGEARGEGTIGMQAVVNVIMNRVKAGSWYGATPKEVVLKKWQFSCWNENDPNREKLLAVTTSDKKYVQALELATLGYYNNLPDLTSGAVNYHATSVLPAWAAKMKQTAQIGNHIFYA